jgi:hypothetical protein
MNGIARLRKILERANEGRGLPHAGADFTLIQI